MVMYVEYTFVDNTGKKASAQTKCHVGSAYPLTSMVKVDSIYVDGDEKACLERLFKNLPHSTGRFTLYTGDFATFIHRNLCIAEFM